MNLITKSKANYFLFFILNYFLNSVVLPIQRKTLENLIFF